MIAAECTVVVVGRWNPAILSPAGIAKRLFGLDGSTPIELLVSLDGMGPQQVRYEGITVAAEWNRLTVASMVCDFDNLRRAMAVARKALDGLPETPVSAAGFNLKYQVSNPSAKFIEAAKTRIDAELLSDYEIRERCINYTLALDDGVLNIQIAFDKDVNAFFNFNFHRDSRIPQGT